MPTIVNSQWSDISGSPQTATLDFTPTAGNVLVAFLAIRGTWTTGSPVTIRDGSVSGDAYTNLTDYGGDAAVGGGGFGSSDSGLTAAARLATGSETAVWVSGTGGGGHLIVVEVSGTTVSAVVADWDSGMVTGATGTGPAVSPASGAPALVFGLLEQGSDFPAATRILAAATGWTTLLSETTESPQRWKPHPVVVYAHVPSPTGSYSPQATSDQFSPTWAALTVAFSGEAPVIVPGIHFDVYTPDGTLVVSLTDLLEKRIRVELNAEGSGFFRIHRSNAAATAANLAKGNIVRVTFTEIDPDPIWEFVIQEGDFQLLSSDEDGGEELSFGGPGTLSVLRNAIVHPVPQDHPTDPDPTDPWERQEGAVKWIDQEAGNIIRRLIQEAEVRGVYGTGTYDITKTFTNTQDTDGNAWVQMGAWLAPIGANLYDEVMRLVAAGQLEIEMAVGLVLNAYQSIGVDRTSTTFATGKVRFVKGVNIADELRRAIPGGEFVSHAIVQGTDGQYVYDDLASYPYVRERYATVNSDDGTVLAEAAAALLGAHEDAQEPIMFAQRVPWPGDGPDEDAGIYLPGPAGTANGLYWVGDLVTLHTGSAEWDYNNATHRVYAITLYEDETGYLAPPIVELNAPFPSEDGEQGALSTATVVASGGGSSGGGGTSGPHVHTLASLSNVDPDAPSDGDVLTYDSGTTRWGPAAPTAEDTVHRADTSDAHDASAVSFTPAGTIAATNVQDAIEEVASEAGAGVTLSDDTPLVESGSGSAGVASTASRSDHEHPADGGGGGGWPAAPIEDWYVGPFVTATTHSVTIAAAAAGQRLIVAISSYSRDVTSVACTNVTFTEVLAVTQGAANLSVYVGIVAGGSSGTTVTVTTGSSNPIFTTVIETSEALTPTVVDDAAMSNALLQNIRGLKLGPITCAVGDIVVLAYATSNATSPVNLFSTSLLFPIGPDSLHGLRVAIGRAGDTKVWGYFEGGTNNTPGVLGLVALT